MRTETSTTMAPAEMQAGLEANGFEVSLQDVAGNAIETKPATPAPPAAAAPSGDVPDATGEEIPTGQEASGQPETPHTEQPPQQRRNRHSYIPPAQRIKRVVEQRNQVQQQLESERVERAQLEQRLKDIEARIAAPAAPAPVPAASAAPEPAAAPAPTAATGEPVAPKMPTLEECNGDWETYQAKFAEHQQALVKYTRDLVKWENEQRIAADQAQQGQKQFEQNIIAKNNEGRQIYSDWDQAFQSAPEVKFSGEFLGKLTQSPLYAHLAYHLAKQPEDATFIASLSPAEQLYEFAQLEMVIEQEVGKPGPRQPARPAALPPPAAPAAAAPPAPRVAPTRTAPVLTPVNPVGASAAPGGDLQTAAETNSRSYRELRKANLRARYGQ